ncbi:uncharacterized protein LOC112595201 [Melanaphis sacchari]|uniref:uncharacterized protein LOC112595201 n=1 Tax=Melanaphis sacchari TaxID=742174 RepID=UPI000DC14FA9|nr:uncharacterized protein LOC112595201 [Melanaphis sacchari]
MVDWTNENVLKLIEVYRSKEIIWNPMNKNHFNKILKNDAWNEIASELSDHISTTITANECKTKIVTILAAYRREKMKIRKSIGTGSGAEDVYKSSWFAFESLEFLKNKDTPRQRRCTMADDNDPTEINQIPTEELQIHSKETQITSENQGSSTQPSKKKKIIKEDGRLDKAFKILESAASASAVNNESQSFGQFVGSKLEKYNQQVRSIVQYEISNILFKADYGYFNQQQLTYQNNHYISDPSTHNYNYHSQSYPMNMHSSSLPYSFPTHDTNITYTPVPQTSPAAFTQSSPAKFTQTSTPVPSPSNTFTSEELDFSDIM